ncbi:Hypothetical predicted protein, partial [Drosophila guanche]
TKACLPDTPPLNSFPCDSSSLPFVFPLLFFAFLFPASTPAVWLWLTTLDAEEAAVRSHSPHTSASPSVLNPPSAAITARVLATLNWLAFITSQVLQAHNLPRHCTPLHSTVPHSGPSLRSVNHAGSRCRLTSHLIHTTTPTRPHAQEAIQPSMGQERGASVLSVVCGAILARNEFKLFAVVSCIKGSFLFFRLPKGCQKNQNRNYLITTIIMYLLRLGHGGCGCV